VTQKTTKGRSSPLGAALSPEGANFCVFSKHATGVDLLLFDNVDDVCPSSVIRIDPATNMIALARKHAKEGDAVLLSTACASFGLFSDYKDRGNQFKAAVNSLK